MKQCPYCNAQIADDSKFCGECGKEYPQVNVCPKCGATVNEGDIYCEICGRNLKDGSCASGDDGKSGIDYMKILLSSLIGIIVGIVILAICSGGWWFFNSSKVPQSNNEAVVDETIEADSLAAEEVEDDFAADSVAVVDVSPREQVKNIYLNLISETNASYYFLADLSGDGIPELFIKKCLDVTCFLKIYTVHNDNTIKLLEVGGSDDGIYIGKDYIIELSTGDDYCVWRKYEFKKYEETSMEEDVVYKGYLEETENFYKEPTEPLLNWNDVSNKEPFTQWNM